MVKSFAERLRRARELRGLSQRELAAKAGVSQAILSMLESGRQDNPTMRVLRQLEDVLGAAMTDDSPEIPASLLAFLETDLGKSLGVTDKELRRLAYARWHDPDEEPNDQAWYDFIRARRALRKRRKSK